MSILISLILRSTTTALTIAAVLSGCALPNMKARVDDDHAEGQSAISPVVKRESLASGSGAGVAGGAADADRRASEQVAQVVLRRASRPWVASVSVPMGTNGKLPS